MIGFGTCGRARWVGLPYVGKVYTLYVHPDYRAKGIGTRLLVALFRRLLENGLGSALVWVLADNPARFFYQAMGGTQVAVRTERLWGGRRLKETAYGWRDLKQARSPTGPSSTV
jgi:GNAT superfamily N-acetyltransferase